MPNDKASRPATSAPALDSGTNDENAIKESVRKWEKDMASKVLETISKKAGAQYEYDRLLNDLRKEKDLLQKNIYDHTLRAAGATSGNYTVIGDDESQISFQTLIEANKRMLQTLSNTIDDIVNGTSDNLENLKNSWEARARDPPTPPKTGSNHFKALKRRATKVLGTLSCSRSK